MRFASGKQAGIRIPATDAQRAIQRAKRAANEAKAQERTAALLRALYAAGVPVHDLRRELPFYGFKSSRPWRFDLADDGRMIAIEIDGGGWIAGRHNRGDRKSERDKLNQAQACGWIVLTFDSTMVRDYLPECVAVVVECYRRRRG